MEQSTEEWLQYELTELRKRTVTLEEAAKGI